MLDPDLLGRLPEGVGQDASFKFDNSAPRWEPLKKLDEVERIERPDNSRIGRRPIVLKSIDVSPARAGLTY